MPSTSTTTSRPPRSTWASSTTTTIMVAILMLGIGGAWNRAERKDRETGSLLSDIVLFLFPSLAFFSSALYLFFSSTCHWTTWQKGYGESADGKGRETGRNGCGVSCVRYAISKRVSGFRVPF
ncbi:hypothetical protein B0T18DRAFT_414996 [Schizothecium vesticola]|uniref:Uncharacterized protein n=1 Tax=Schizothecium vesticola TaxID=314040 RepID=A0AA40K291_9PEZI|nr:hypothetical protein B0T18DRAFT_414996 [Schizothecium vesticola]